MKNNDQSNKKFKNKHGTDTGFIWFLGSIGTFIYYIQNHSGSIGLVLIALFKAIFWPAYLVYYLFEYLKV